MSNPTSGPDLKARSPWAGLSGIKSASLIPPAAPILGELRVPGSKSYTNRALIIAAVSHGTSKLSGILKSDDSYWCIESLKELGVDVSVEGDTATVKGCGGKWPKARATIYIGAAGTTARFLPGTLAALPGGEFLLEASERMSQRPIGELVTALNSLGGNLTYQSPPNSFPLKISGTGLKGGPVTVSGKISSQFLSGILIASPLAKSQVEITVTDGIVQHSYIHMTLDLMREFGSEISFDKELTHLSVKPKTYQARSLSLEADASTCGYFLALAALTQGKVRITNLTYGTSQPDIKMLDLFEKMGCSVTKGDTFVELKGAGKLRGGFTMSMREMSDQALTLAAVAPFADAPITITEVAHIRHHESDRIHAMVESLKKLGIRAEEHEDGLTVYPGTPKGCILESYDDHRMAMSLSLIASRVPGITILDPGCVSKTCPNFFDEIKKLGMGVSLK